jgi:ABC-type branched-subunit amino acid transport system ATPase component/ABC-type branched-subunit amino acid transport system permease subunit
MKFKLASASIALYVGFVLIALAAPSVLPVYPLFVLSLAVVNIIAVLGVNVTMGYAGQISLGHAGFAAIGAYTTALLMAHGEWAFWIALPAGGLVAGAFGYLLGLPALRLGPLYVSMVTFGFGFVVVLILQNWYELANGPNGMAVPPPRMFGNDMTPHQFHYFVVVVATALFVVTHNVINSRIGRAFVALRESEVAARAMGVNVAATKTLAFGLGAAYAGIAGGLFAGLTQFINPDSFVFGVSISYVTMAILGGSGFFAGPIVGGLTLTVLPELLRGAAEYKELLTGFVLLMFLIFLPRGLVGLLWGRFSARPDVIREVRSIKTEAIDKTERPDSNRELLRVTDVSLSFGGLAALKNVSFEVNEGEIVSIIGPNGAGKTSLFNTISGLYSPNMGAIEVAGQSVTGYPAHRRAQMGISRTFQNLELFQEMTALDNVLVGAHGQLANSTIESAFRLPGERKREAEQRSRALELLEFVGLLHYAEERAGNLSFGHQRLLEIARALASRPMLLMLDEPAAGLNSTELSALADIIRLVRTRYGASVLLIAHTMNLVMALSDRVIVLHHGVKIADGTPGSIQKDAAVIDAYLGEVSNA